MRQLHDRLVFKIAKVETLTKLKRHRAIESLIFLTENRDGKIKARTPVNSSTKR